MDCKKAQSLVTAYIMRKLNDKDLEDFLEHVDSCEECYEELEIYYTVHYTIARLDEDEADQVYNVKKALQNRLEESRFYIWRTKVSRIYRMGLMVLAELLLVVILMTQADLSVSVRHMLHFFHTFQILCRLRAIHCHLVMIADDQMLVPSQLAQIPIRTVVTLIAEISYNIYIILRIDPGIPQMDQCMICLLYTSPSPRDS